MLYPIELRAPIPVVTAEAALGVRDDARTAHRFAVSESTRDEKRRQGKLPARGANRAARGAWRNKKGRGKHRSPMGGTRLELVTSTMSTWRSNQLS